MINVLVSTFIKEDLKDEKLKDYGPCFKTGNIVLAAGIHAIKN
jgi:hypothetical protein